MTNSTQKQIADLIKRSEHILILPSSPPDGDSIGGAVAFYLVLKKMGKDVTVICNDQVPDVLQFLPNIKVIGNKVVTTSDFIVTIDLRNASVDKVSHEIENNKLNIIISPKEGRFSENDVSFNKGESNYDLIITIDCAELKQLRDFYENNIELFHQVPIINIDHHISNTHFGKINHVDIMASATTELLLSLFEEMARDEKQELIDEDVATLLLTGIITDTGSFQNANTTPKAFDRAAQLVAYGARQQEIIQHVYKTKRLSQLKLWGRVLSKIQTDEKYKIVWSLVSQQDFKDTGSTEDETGDIIDELMTNAPEAEVVILMKEKGENIVSGSIRTTTPSIDASALAENFGGGGHNQAAGFRITGLNLRDAEYQVIDTVRKSQEIRLGIIKEEPVVEVMPPPVIKEKIKEPKKIEIKETIAPPVSTVVPEVHKIPEISEPEKEEPVTPGMNPYAKPKEKHSKKPNQETEKTTQEVSRIYRFED